MKPIGEKTRILMIEDDLGVLKLNKSVLKRQGYNIEAATNLKDAHSILFDFSYSIMMFSFFFMTLLL